MNNLSVTRLISVIVIPAALLFTACGEEPFISPLESKNLVRNSSSEVQVAWNNVFLVVDRYAEGYRPGPTPRALAYLGLAAYEACISGMPGYNSLRDHYPELNLPDADPTVSYHWPTVVHGVYTAMMSRLYPDPNPEAKVLWDDLVSDYNARFLDEAGQVRYEVSLVYGRSVGDAMWAWSATDHYGHDAYLDPYSDYDWAAHYTGLGDWVPTFPGPGRGMFPYMGKFRTLAIKVEDKISYPPSVYFMDYSTNTLTEYHSQALQTYTKNADTDYATEWIGEFWSDDLVNLTFSPGARWIAITNQVVTKEVATLETSLETFAKVGIALNDAVVACWHSKYLYNVESPETYIRANIDPDYQTNLDNPLTGEEGITPSYPAFPSGHATMGAACAEVLSSVFGYAYSMTDRCHQGRTQFEGTPRTFGSFYEMAQENAWSRVLLGVHWRMDADEGVRFGTGIGRKVNGLEWKK